MDKKFRKLAKKYVKIAEFDEIQFSIDTIKHQEVTGHFILLHENRIIHELSSVTCLQGELAVLDKIRLKINYTLIKPL